MEAVKRTICHLLMAPVALICVAEGALAQATITVSPASLTFAVASNAGQSGGTVSPQTLWLTAANKNPSTSVPLSFTVALSSSLGSFVSVNPASGTTFSEANDAVALTVQVNPAGLSAKIYSGSITIATSPATLPITVPVTINVSTAPILYTSALPTGLTFNYQTGTGATQGVAPAAQWLTFASSGGGFPLSLSASQNNCGNFFSVSSNSIMVPAAGSGTASVAVQVDPALLTAGPCTGAIAVNSSAIANGGSTIPVTGNVSSSPFLRVPVSITATIGPVSGNVPAQGQIVIESSDGSAQPVTLSGANLVLASPTSGVTPLTVTLLTSGAGNVEFEETLTITSPNAANSQVNIPVHVTLAGQPGPPTINQVSTSAGSLDLLGPNTWLSIYGSNFTAGGVTYDWSHSIVNGNLPTTLGGVGVTVGGLPAYVNYVSSTQINVLTPNIGFGPLQVTVSTTSGLSTLVTITSQQDIPAFFPWPNNQPVATHADYTYAVANGTFPTLPTVPAMPGETIVLWGSGFGPTTPATPQGVPVPATGAFLSGPVTVTLNGQAVPVYLNAAALASGSAGVYQVGITIPISLTNGSYPLVTTIGGLSSSPLMLTVGGGPPPLSITGPAGLPSGTVGAPYTQTTISASGGTGLYTWTATGLPAGLSIDPSGVISGTPASNSAGLYTMGATVVDSSGVTASKAYLLVINPATTGVPIITSPLTLPNGTVGVAYPQTTITATGGTLPLSWTARGLPAGLSISSSGVITGTPGSNSAGGYSPGMTVTDSKGATGSKSYQLTINSH